ncbi:MAG: hypothetical protein JXA37_10585 [Chloroflexia bacterium]|nr:hypothetical protein [Chloroflexia bacterium]
MKHKWIWTLGIVLLLGLALSACTATMSVEVSQEEIRQAIAEGLADSKLDDLELELQDGYVLVRAEKEHPDGSGTDSLNFRLDLGVSDGRLTATISEAQHNGAPIDEEQVAQWNERIAERLERATKRRPNSELQSVTVSADKIVVTWSVTVRRAAE